MSASIFDFIYDILCGQSSGRRSETDRLEETALVMAFQQLTGPISAKGVEDTAFYRYTRLISLNEVGGEPSRFGVPVEAFHELNATRLARWPGSLSSTSTHDTKRSDDVRARLNVLSEIPHEWRAKLRTWFRLNKPRRAVLDGMTVPDPNEEYLLYQTLLGAWPIEPVSDAEYEEFTERIQSYMWKALREAKVHMSWVNPNPALRQGGPPLHRGHPGSLEGLPPERQPGPVRRLLSTLVPGASGNVFLHDFLPFQRKIATCGMFNSLSQTLLKLASPGVADTYRGTEIWDLSLVDPDNRRPVDFARRRAMLDELRTAIAQTGSDLSALARSLVDSKEDGRIKLYLTMQGLRYRRQHPALFLAGAYHPLDAAGPRKEHLCAFARRTESHVAVAVAPRFLARLDHDGPPLGKAVWQRTWLLVPAEWRGHRYRNVLTGEVVPVSSHEGRPALPVDAVLSSFPVALLELRNASTNRAFLLGAAVPAWSTISKEAPMEFGAVLPIWRLTTADAERLALRAEELGWDGVFVPDHILAKPATTQHYGPSWPDPFSLLAFLAGRTRRIQVGASVIVLPYRNPLVTAKAAATVDQVSGGRFIFGIGVGWDEAEFKDLNLPFKERGAQADEYLRIIKTAWAADQPGRGPLLHVRRGHLCAAAGPEAASPHLGGRGAGALSAPAMRRAAEQCDAWHPLALSWADLEKGMATVRELARRAGRPDGAVRVAPRNMLALGARDGGAARPPYSGSPEEVAADVKRAQALGCDWLTFDMPAAADVPGMIAVIERFAKEVRPAAA